MSVESAPSVAASWWRRRPWLVTLGFALAYAVAVMLGRATRLEGSQLALVWPAAAVAFLWLASSWTTRRVVLDLAVLGTVTAAANFWTGATAGMSLVFAAANCAQAAVTCAVMHRLQPEAWRLRRPADLAVLVTACVAGSAASSPIAPVGLWLTTGIDLPAAVAAWALRNASNTFVFAAVVLRLADRGVRMTVPRGRELTELIAASVVLAVAYTAVFGEPVALPLAYLLLPLSMWIALRFGSTVAAAHVLLAGVFVVVLTMYGRGPFAAVDPSTRVLLAQAFVAVVGLVALVLALHQDERRELIDSLEAARRQAADQAALFEAVLETIDVGVVACDADGRLMLFNRATREFHGLPEDRTVDPADWAGRFDLYAEDGRTRLAPDEVPLLSALHDGEVHDRTITIAPRGRPAHTVRCDGRAMFGPDGFLLGAVVAMKDVTDLRASEQRFRAAFQDGPTPMARLAADGAIQEVNPALRRFLAMTSTLLVGRDLSDLAHPDDRATVRSAVDGPGTGSNPVEVRVLRADRAPVWCEVATTRGAGPDGQEYVLVQLLDVHARKTQELALERAARRDPLTGLGNRQVLDDCLADLLEPAAGPGATLLFIDLDGFKAINDTYGHDAGDTVLVEVARRLQASIRAEDTAVRLGGDEFVVVSPSRNGNVEAAASAVARRLEQVLTRPVDHAGARLAVGASVGMAAGSRGADPATLLADADRAMYRRKARARARVAVA